MEKKYNPLDYNNAIPCEVCGNITFADDYGNTSKCSRCGWSNDGNSILMEKWHGISYPMLVPLSRARAQYNAGQKFKATFEDFINGLMFYSEMLFWHNGKIHEVRAIMNGPDMAAYESGACTVIFAGKEFQQEYTNIAEFRNKATIGGRLLKDIWDEVVHPCFMYCGSTHDYDFPPED